MCAADSEDMVIL